MAFVPVGIFEDADAVYITPEHYFELAGERVDGGTHYYDECNQITNSLELLRDHDIPMLQFWKLVVQEVRDEGELEDFIKARFGSGCSLGEQVASAQAGVFDVSILGDGKDLAESQCPMNYGYRVKYFPSGGRVIAWNIGQAWTFLSAVDWSAGYDFEMIESFRFLAGAAAPAAGTPVAPEGPLTRYTNDEFGFAFQYPADWSLEVVAREPADGGEGMPQWLADAVVLSQGEWSISIQYIRISELGSVAWNGNLGGGGLYQEAQREPVTLMGQEVQKMVWTDGEGIQAMGLQVVIEAADLALQIALYDNSVLWIGDPAAEALPEMAIDVLEGVLSSLTLIQ
jgi:hypothetical protein